MKKVLSIIFVSLLASLPVFALSEKDVSGMYNGELSIANTPEDASVYLLPGTVENTITFVLPNFAYEGGLLGDIVLANIAMDANTGELSLENSTIYLELIETRAAISVLNKTIEGVTYESKLSSNSAKIALAIDVEGLNTIYVTFIGSRNADANYVITNGSFEGAWTKHEPAGWHSFVSADGKLKGTVNTENGIKQFIQSSDVRPGSSGQYSALLSTRIILGIPANGNCTNGRLNAGATIATDTEKNYNYSDPDSTGYNTAFNGRPDSLVFWAKYIPADRNAGNELNQARAHSVITTNARYQDPEAIDYSSIKIGEAEINYSATSNLGWQRISVPFTYEDRDKEPAYILTTFTTNKIQGGGSAKEAGQPDSVYLDDVKLVYNMDLETLTATETLSSISYPVNFENHIAKMPTNYCDSCYSVEAICNGISSHPYICYDGVHKCAYVYVIADDYTQTNNYNLYRVEFEDSNVKDLKPIADGLMEILSNVPSHEKVVINGQLLIRHGDNLYTTTGVRLQ